VRAILGDTEKEFKMTEKEIIVMLPDYNGYKNVLWLSTQSVLNRRNSNDFYDGIFKNSMFYVTAGKRKKCEKLPSRKSYIFVGDNGKKYAIFSDFSAKEII
jgi:hypothetical protein